MKILEDSCNIIANGVQLYYRKGSILTKTSEDFIREHSINKVIASNIKNDLNLSIIARHIELFKVNIETKKLLTRTMDKKVISELSNIYNFDCGTYLHSLHTAIIAILIVNKTGLSSREIFILSKASLLHDVGKAIIPVDILNSYENLSEDNWSIMRLHPKEGAEYLNKMGIDRNVVNCVKYHHEKLDGTGYYGIKDTAIDIANRILTTADIFSALTLNRTYRNALSALPAIGIMYEQFKGQLDFKYVQILKQLVESGEVYNGSYNIHI